LAKLKAEETRKKDLLTELDRLNMPADAVNFDEARLKREIHQRCEGSAWPSTSRGAPDPP